LQKGGKLSAKTVIRLTPRQRLTRGLKYTAAGPVDVTRGVLGLGVDCTQAGASNLRRRYRKRRLGQDLQATQETTAQEVAAAQDVVSGLPRALRQARRHRRGRRPWVLVALTATALAGAAVAFSTLRRSSHPEEPSPRPPSVDVQPRP
jgi:hypothetical protein